MALEILYTWTNILSPMGKQWQRERKREYYYKKAKRNGFRSRAAYKLIQINEKFKVIRKGDVIVDLGAAPGGWSQVALQLAGETGTVIGVDLENIRPIDNAIFLRGDIRMDDTRNSIEEAISGVGKKKAGVVISDMAPNISGNYSTDHANSIYLAQMALDVATNVLKRGGCFIVKVFEGDMFPSFRDEVKSKFRSVKLHSPKASRSSSSEIYVIAKGFTG